MKRFIPLVLATLFAIPAFGQYEIKKGTVYSLNMDSPIKSVNSTWSSMSQYCDLWLFDDGTYTIEIESGWEYLWTGELGLLEAKTLTVSVGRYYWDGDKLHCKDIITSAPFDFISSDLNLIAATGLPFMENSVFSGFRKGSHSFPDLSKAMTDDKLQELANTLIEPNQLNNAKYITYLNEFLVLTIDIRPDNTYNMEYGGLLISQGKWERSRNLLVLHDSNVGGNFYALIGDNELTINILNYGQKTLSVLEDDVDFITCPEPEIGFIGSPWTEIEPGYDDVFVVVEEEPEYPGGTAALLEYFRETMEYPQDALRDNIEGRVIVKFIVEEDGSITHLKVLKSISPSVDAEALRLINRMPKWKPGKQNGKTCRVSYSVPISFRINR